MFTRALSLYDAEIVSAPSPHRFSSLVTTLLLLSAFAIGVATSPARAAVPVAESTWLTNLYNNTAGATWTTNTNWLTGDPCDDNWYGIFCNATNTNVTEIGLWSNNLVGTLPTGLDQLTALQRISVGYNQLTGSIPSLTGLNSLQIFAVIGNQLTGAIPSLAGLSSLEFFDVSVNQLTGAIPSLVGLTNLQYLHAYDNQLSGAIPSLAGLSSLESFHVTDNQLTGAIPSLTGLTDLKNFQVSNNQLTGAIPALPDWLEYAGFAGNLLSGAVPAAPSALLADGSSLCDPPDPRNGNTNLLTFSPNPATNTAWNTATGMSDWSVGCKAGPKSTTSVPALDAKALTLLAMFILLLGRIAVGKTGIGQRKRG